METTKLTYDQIVTILGNGDMAAGSDLLQNLAHGLSIARQKHGWGKGREIDAWRKAKDALKGEYAEWVDAMRYETPERQLAEILDVMIVAARVANREWEAK